MKLFRKRKKHLSYSLAVTAAIRDMFTEMGYSATREIKGVSSEGHSGKAEHRLEPDRIQAGAA